MDLREADYVKCRSCDGIIEVLTERRISSNPSIECRQTGRSAPYS